ncbi:MAG TPA: alpha/beta hydrolase-fold protein [Blastocatellia bacterium]|nr:alpha/beta hydrolase-fold protein [Blastocatellia bacterium]HMX24318.1 alpha/beta hydrolase-fold protein [Blastocatellia bacterium]HMY75503.1 alpha/beta hydrolase-fold protein [Blastocatellia bacterium]HMZ19726.1 alpha/beta hydrolase-fold protein [Blastocatellia bacterium]HNG33128.1 alpha/beta hydrolase-fold protein [Blastocatellia bacterium]
MKRRILFVASIAFCLSLLAIHSTFSAPAETRFEISYPAALDNGPITGRVFVIISKTDRVEPRLQAGSYQASVPFYGLDVSALKPGESAVIDAGVLGYQVKSLSELPAGEYFVQALLNVYTQVHRKDGHTIWVHMDQWEGQQWNRSPGNLISEVQRVRLDPASGFNVKLALTKKLPPVVVPPDTEWVKRVKIQSKLLTEFWGHPIYLGATVLLPKGYTQETTRKYPTIYSQGHFGLNAPFGFTTNAPAVPESAEQRKARLARSARETAYEFSQAWMSENFPRMVAVTFQHPTPYYDDSYAVNSANNGPYGDALLTELIPYLEKNFRLIPEARARVLTGGSTGGWESLALQILHPKFFNGVWSLYPDPVDFRRYQMSNVYEDDNAFEVPAGDWAKLIRPLSRDANGQVTLTMREMSQLEEVLGSRIRSGQQIAAWDAAYGPVGKDGYPRPIWDRRTGKIDREVALYMRDNGYDLRYNLEQNWAKIGPDLVGKIHVYCGDMDNYYLNLAVYMMEDFLKAADNPKAEAVFEYGRPMKPHGWQPFTSAEMVRMMDRHINKKVNAAAR